MVLAGALPRGRLGRANGRARRSSGGAWDELWADATDRVGGPVAKLRVERSQMQLKRRAWAKKRLKTRKRCWDA